MDDKWDSVIVVVTFSFVVVVIAAFLLSPYFEAKAFNKFSKTKATYWDALWTELRVMPDK
jgi:hypothetical protein